jgi:arylsulfatase A-like enzyme
MPPRVGCVQRSARRLGLGAILVLVSLAVAGSPVPPASGQAPGPPNILVIVTDDQRATETLDVMPKTMRWFGQGGTVFPDAYATTPLCCPARAAIMTGRFNHNNGVLDNGDQAKLDHNSTIQRYLRQRGYLTAAAGKLLNGWPLVQNPPHFDRWAIMHGGYYNSDFNVNGTVQSVPQYSTDFVADRATGWINGFFETNDARPWYLYVTPFAPHGPWTAEGGHPSDDDDFRNANVGTWAGNPAVFETDESDKPEYVQRDDQTFQEGQSNRQGQLRSLLSVDDLVEDIFAALEARGEQNTLAFYISDNGFFWSEHGLDGKNAPYTQSIRVPFMSRWPGHIAAGATDVRPVANVDIVATIMAAAGFGPDPQYPIDGRSILDRATRRKMLTESWPGGSRGPWASTRTPSYQYIEYYDDTSGAVDFREYYDLTLDPWQLTNLYADGNPRNDPWIGALADELAGLRNCVGDSCRSRLDEPAIPLRCPGATKRPGQHLVGSDRRDVITGHPWRDVICGRKGRDTLRGQGGKDRLIGHTGPDKLFGGPGRDLLDGKGGRDVCRGGPGRDTFLHCEVEQG